MERIQIVTKSIDDYLATKFPDRCPAIDSEALARSIIAALPAHRFDGPPKRGPWVRGPWGSIS